MLQEQLEHRKQLKQRCSVQETLPLAKTQHDSQTLSDQALSQQRVALLLQFQPFIGVLASIASGFKETS